MCLAQLLLIRALTAAFWQQPYRRPLVRWGTALHDRFMLHHYVREDLAEVCDYLREAGFDYKPEWLEPFFEFRFPVLGRIDRGETELELRAGIEPWHVLGEELGSSGTARYVDSSVERVQVRVSGFHPDRFAILCNRTEVPLSPTGREGEFVAGIRYKAWNPPSALHPTIKPDVPLVFDIYDRWNERSVGGCTYHVAHPGGRSYDTFPVNTLEAEGRRVNRFQDTGHSLPEVTEVLQAGGGAQVQRSVVESTNSPKKLEVRKPPARKEFARTLDLRWV
jgi:uncharacterized protein (DUF2126 family)